MNIFIVGPMGSGKTTVGKIVAGELFLDFHDTDTTIENNTGVSIDWIFDIERFLDWLVSNVEYDKELAIILIKK